MLGGIVVIMGASNIIHGTEGGTYKLGGKETKSDVNTEISDGL